MRRVAFPRVIVAVLKKPHGVETVEEFRGAVLATVCIDEEIINTDGTMIGDPFKNIGRFIFHAADDDIARAPR